jgi:hypothetical protein
MWRTYTGSLRVLPVRVPHGQKLQTFGANVPGSIEITIQMRSATTSPSGVTSKPASCGHFKTGQLNASRTASFYLTLDLPANSLLRNLQLGLY